MTRPDNPAAFPPPCDRRTHGVFRTPEEALQQGRNLIYLLHGVPWGYRFGVFERLGAFALVSYPTKEDGQ